MIPVSETSHLRAQSQCWRDRLDKDGFAVVREVIPPSRVETLRDAFAELQNVPAVRRRSSVFGVRNLSTLVPETTDLVRETAIRNLVEPVLGSGAFAVRGVYFDKPPDANWYVPWHQDLTIAVEKRVEYAGYGPWSVKAGVDHVQPPASVLNRMLTVRVHLDRADVSNGALRVLPGSHRCGRISTEAIAAWRANATEVCCTAESGDALVMRPLLLRASSPSVVPNHRRVIHIDFSASELPSSITWYERIALRPESGELREEKVRLET